MFYMKGWVYYDAELNCQNSKEPITKLKVQYSGSLNTRHRKLFRQFYVIMSEN